MHTNYNLYITCPVYIYAATDSLNCSTPPDTPKPLQRYKTKHQYIYKHHL